MDRSKWTLNDWENYLRGWQEERLGPLGMGVAPTGMGNEVRFYAIGINEARAGRKA